MVTDLMLSLVQVEGLTQKYASMVLTHRIASLVSLEKSAGRATLTSVVLVVVDMGFTGGGGGLIGGWGGGTVGRGAKIDGIVVGTTEDTVITKGVTGGSGLVTGMLGWKPEGGNGVLCLGGECYDFFPLPCLFPHLRSTTPLLLFCPFLPGDRLILTCFPVLLLSSLYFPFSTALFYRTVSLLSYLSHGNYVSPTFHVVLRLST